MIIFKNILYKVAIEAVKGSTEMPVNKIEFDSRKIQENDAFVAIRGSLSNGHDFIETAINQGAIAVVCDTFPDVIVTGITYVKVKDIVFLNFSRIKFDFIHKHFGRTLYGFNGYFFRGTEFNS